MNSNSGIEQIFVEKYKSEPIWFAIVLMLSLVIWIALIVSIIGIIYAILLASFFFISHIGFIAYMRGNAVRIGPNQFPDLYNRIRLLSSKIGIENPPDAYIMQAGGTLNALATKLFSKNFIVLYSDLLEACGENEQARDMIIGHELGHIRSGHLSIVWLIIPGLFFPFIGTAYSRAREFTCDRYGAALCGDKNSALRGLAILSAGPKYGPKINFEPFILQQNDLNTGLMTIGMWLSTHPPLSERISKLDPDIVARKFSNIKGKIRGLIIILLLGIIPILLSIGVYKKISQSIVDTRARLNMTTSEDNGQNYNSVMDVKLSEIKVEEDFILLAKLVKEVKQKTGNYPSSESGMLSSAWLTYNPKVEEPKDPFDGKAYGYYLIEDGFVIWSTGPDGVEETTDDIIYNSVEREN